MKLAGLSLPLTGRANFRQLLCCSSLVYRFTYTLRSSRRESVSNSLRQIGEICEIDDPLFSVPPATEMFHFTGCTSPRSLTEET